MNTKLLKILAVTIFATMSLSCSMALLNDEEAALNGEFTITVNGVVSNVVTNAPLEGMKITFEAFDENSLSVMPLISLTDVTDSKGVYTIKAKGFSDPVTCIITAESTEETGQYETMTNKVVVTWSGNSFDPESKTFFVNDCNFQMKRAD
mgnify:FL=1